MTDSRPHPSDPVGGVARRADLELPPIGLGTMRQSGPACTAIVEAALAEGYRHIDTARRYGNEAEVGAGIRASSVPRDELVLATKLGPGDLARDRVRPALQDSLRQLGLGYVDLLLVHWPSTEVPLEETLGEMVALCDDGLVRAIGVANVPSTMLRGAAAIATLVTDQVEYHPYLAQRSVLAACREIGAVLTAYCPLARAGGLLADPVVVDIAGAHGRTPAQIVLRWLVQQPGVVAIPGASSPEHLRQNLDVGSFALASDEMDALASLARNGRVVDPPHAPVWDRG